MIYKKDSKINLQPIKEKAAFEEKLKQLNGIEFESLQDFLIALSEL